MNVLDSDTSPPIIKKTASRLIQALASAFGVTFRVNIEVSDDPSITLPPGLHECVFTGDTLTADQPRASVPITYKGRLIGSVGTVGTHITRKSATLAAEAVAATLAMNMEQSQVARQSALFGHELERLRQQVFRSHEDVLKLVAMDVHDVISQHLAFLYFQIQLFEGYIAKDSPEARHRFTVIRDLARSLVEDTSRLLTDLRPPHLDDLGLVTALNRYFESFTKQSGIPVHCSVAGDWRRTTDFRAVALYRIVQEALTNTWKHAQASRIVVTMQAVPGRLMVTVEDDGIGFDSEKVLRTDKSNGFGIYTMGERAALCSGEIHISSRPGQGCTVHATLPESGGLTAKLRR